MFDFKNLGDMTKLASQAKEMQKQQNFAQEEQTQLLKKISNTLEQILQQLIKK
ncbi:MAG: hypothetical protein PHQ52_08315 [Candidatus Omnitrophica bacterium]|nr:hypothetical protein [Candidatus Omnitrophota bacterium]